MKIQIDGQDILEINEVELKALYWRLADPREWIKNAIIGQISHAKGEMIKHETQRIRGKEQGMPQSMSENDMVTWLSTQQGYKTAAEKKAEQEAK